ncbi:MAG TPA: hypothetical protein VFO28_00245 [Burkholderiaceae bacterium]|nr:hypothetical protein [Burkholderiaceae bacterium]
MVLMSSFVACGVAAPVSIPPAEYDMTAQTVLPHLEEALRYATTRTRECLREPDATRLFPLLLHPAFAGCHLVPAEGPGDESRFVLRCANPEAASGTAVFDVGAHNWSAVLDLKMGAKNMTLSQRLTGTRVGLCRAMPP